jgi:large subunit ribosomal protein L1
MAKHGKKYLAAAAKVDPNQAYAPETAVALVKETSITKFDGTVEVHMRLGVDPRHADQQVRDVVVLPHGLGKTVRVLVFAQGEGATLARDGGADVVADDDETLTRIQQGWTEFDVAIATPDVMGKVGRLGRVLGPRGLMPNPKAGTVVPAEDLPRVIR